MPLDSLLLFDRYAVFNIWGGMLDVFKPIVTGVEAY